MGGRLPLPFEIFTQRETRMTRAIFFSYYFYADSFNAVITQNRHHPVYENKGYFLYPSDEVWGGVALACFKTQKSLNSSHAREFIIYVMYSLRNSRIFLTSSFRKRLHMTLFIERKIRDKNNTKFTR